MNKSNTYKSYTRRKFLKIFCLLRLQCQYQLVVNRLFTEDTANKGVPKE